MRLIWLGLAVATLAACSTRPPAAPSAPVTPVPTGAADTCGATPFLYLIGEPATALERVLILRQVRVNWPEDRVDAFTKPERLNFNIGPGGRVASVTCG